MWGNFLFPIVRKVKTIKGGGDFRWVIVDDSLSVGDFFFNFR